MIKKIALTLFGACFFTTCALFSQTTWTIDKLHSKMGFSVMHMMVSELEGNFTIYDGKISSKSDTSFVDAELEFSMSASSINSGDENRDKSLKASAFLDAEKFPLITFKSLSMKPTKTKGTYELTGNLTIKGITKKETFLAAGAPKAVKDPWTKKVRYAFKVTGHFNRYNYDMKANSDLEEGGVMIGEEVNISCTIAMLKE